MRAMRDRHAEAVSALCAGWVSTNCSDSSAPRRKSLTSCFAVSIVAVAALGCDHAGPLTDDGSADVGATATEGSTAPIASSRLPAEMPTDLSWSEVVGAIRGDPEFDGVWRPRGRAGLVLLDGVETASLSNLRMLSRWYPHAMSVAEELIGVARPESVWSDDGDIARRLIRETARLAEAGELIVLPDGGRTSQPLREGEIAELVDKCLRYRRANGDAREVVRFLSLFAVYIGDGSSSRGDVISRLLERDLEVGHWDVVTEAAARALAAHRRLSERAERLLELAVGIEVESTRAAAVGGLLSAIFGESPAVAVAWADRLMQGAAVRSVSWESAPGASRVLIERELRSSSPEMQRLLGALRFQAQLRRATGRQIGEIVLAAEQDFRSERPRGWLEVLESCLSPWTGSTSRAVITPPRGIGASSGLWVHVDTGPVEWSERTIGMVSPRSFVLASAPHLLSGDLGFRSAPCLSGSGRSVLSDAALSRVTIESATNAEIVLRVDNIAADSPIALASVELLASTATMVSYRRRDGVQRRRLIVHLGLPADAPEFFMQVGGSAESLVLPGESCMVTIPLENVREAWDEVEIVHRPGVVATSRARYALNHRFSVVRSKD